MKIGRLSVGSAFALVVSCLNALALPIDDFRVNRDRETLTGGLEVSYRSVGILGGVRKRLKPRNPSAGPLWVWDGSGDVTGVQEGGLGGLNLRADGSSGFVIAGRVKGRNVPVRLTISVYGTRQEGRVAERKVRILPKDRSGRFSQVIPFPTLEQEKWVVGFRFGKHVRIRWGHHVAAW